MQLPEELYRRVKRLAAAQEGTLATPRTGACLPIWKRAEAAQFPVRRIFDARLAHTLRHHGVEEFATRNTKHFRQFGFPRPINPIDESSSTS